MTNPITALPTAPTRNEPATFADRGDALIAALPRLVSEINTFATALNNFGCSGTSTTSLAIGTGNKSLTVEINKGFVTGMAVKIASTASPTNWMLGDVVSYDITTGALVVSVAYINGSGTVAAWSISLTVSGGNAETGLMRISPTVSGGMMREYGGLGLILGTGYLDFGKVYNCAIDIATQTWLGRDVGGICVLHQFSNTYGGVEEIWFAPTAAAGVVPAWTRVSLQRTSTVGALLACLQISGDITASGKVNGVQVGIFDQQIFNAGSGTWTRPAGIQATAVAEISLVASGSSGASRATTGNASGGSACAYTIRIPAAYLSATESYSVGALVNGVTGDANGAQGNASTFTIGGLVLSSGRPVAPGHAALGVASLYNAVAGVPPSFDVATAASNYSQANSLGGTCSAGNVPTLGTSMLGGGVCPGAGGACSSAVGGVRNGVPGLGAGGGGAGGANTGGNGVVGVSPGGGGGAAVQGGTSGYGATGRIIVTIFN